MKAFPHLPSACAGSRPPAWRSIRPRGDAPPRRCRDAGHLEVVATYPWNIPLTLNGTLFMEGILSYLDFAISGICSTGLLEISYKVCTSKEQLDVGLASCGV